MGGHLEVDPAVPLDGLLKQLDELDLDNCLAVYERLEAAFIKACRGVIYLAQYAADGERLRGVRALTQTDKDPFDPARPDELRSVERPRFDEAEYERQFRLWMEGGQDERAAAASYFYDAFAGSPIDQVITRVEQMGPSIRNHTIDLRTGHTFIGKALANASDDEEIARIVDLMLHAARGWPTALTEILLNHLETPSRISSIAIVRAFGELAPWWNEAVRSHLYSAAKSGDLTLRLSARAALMRVYLRDEISNRPNRRPSSEVWDDLRQRLLEGLEPNERLLLLIIFFSQFCERLVATLNRHFEYEIEISRAELLAELKRFAGVEACQAHEAMLTRLLDRIDTAGLVLLLATELTPDDETGLVEGALAVICFGPAVYSQGNDALRHLALCHHRFGSTEAAIEILAWLAKTNPENIDHQLLHIELLAQNGGNGDLVRSALRLLKAHYTLDEQGAARVASLEGGLTVDAPNQPQ